MKTNNLITVSIIVLDVILVAIAVNMGQQVAQKLSRIEALARMPQLQYFYSEYDGFSFQAPLKYTITSSFDAITIDRKDTHAYLSMSYTESYKTDTRSVLEELEFYSGNKVDVTVDTYHGFDRYQYMSGPREGDLYYLKPLKDYFFVGLYGNDPSYKQDMDIIAASFEYNDEKE